MDTATKPLEELVRKLRHTGKVRDFAEFLLAKRERRTETLRQDWAGALREYRQQYTSLEFQRQALDWRGD